MLPLSTTKTHHGQQWQPAAYYDAEVVRERPVFHPEFGGNLRELREQRKWTQRRAAAIALQKGHAALTRQILIRLENGQVKNPEPEVLRAVAGLYNLPYEPLAATRCADARNGVAASPFLLRRFLRPRRERANPIQHERIRLTQALLPRFHCAAGSVPTRAEGRSVLTE